MCRMISPSSTLGTVTMGTWLTSDLSATLLCGGVSAESLTLVSDSVADIELDSRWSFTVCRKHTEIFYCGYLYLKNECHTNLHKMSEVACTLHDGTMRRYSSIENVKNVKRTKSLTSPMTEDKWRFGLL